MQKKIKSVFCFMVFLQGCYTPSHRLPMQGDKPILTSDIGSNCPVKIQTILDRHVFRQGDMVIVHIILTFQGSTIYLEQNDFFHCYQPYVISPSGKLLELSSEGIFYVDDNTGGSVQIGKVGPKFVDRYDFNLSKLYLFSVPGYYRVCFKRMACNAPKFADPAVQELPKPQFVGTIQSDYATFDVVDK